MLTEQMSGCGADAGRLTAKVGEVQVRLKNLRFAPAAFERDCRGDLPQLLSQSAAIGSSRERGIDEGGELHREGARTAACISGRPIECRARERSPVDTMVLAEAAICSPNDRVDERSREIRERYPLQTTFRIVHPGNVQQRTVSIEQIGFGRSVAGFHGSEVGWLDRARGERDRT